MFMELRPFSECWESFWLELTFPRASKNTGGIYLVPSILWRKRKSQNQPAVSSPHTHFEVEWVEYCPILCIFSLISRNRFLNISNMCIKLNLFDWWCYLFPWLFLKKWFYLFKKTNEGIFQNLGPFASHRHLGPVVLTQTICLRKMVSNWLLLGMFKLLHLSTP